MPAILQNIMPTLGALGVVIALVMGASRAVQRFGLARTQPGVLTRRLTIQDTLCLDRTRRLHLIRCDRRELLLVSGGSGPDVIVGWVSASEIQA